MYIELASPKPSELFCPDGHPFLSSGIFHSNTFFISSHYAGTFGFHLITLSSALHYYLSVIYVAIIATIAHLVSFTDSEFTSNFSAVLTGCVPSLSTPLDLRSISLPFRLCVTYRLKPWLLTLVSDSSMFSPTYRDCTLHVPRRLWKVRCSKPLLILCFSENHRRGVELP